ncbi:hypothetical protein E2C01_070143 [Portunus trituberculatus]|uniref:Uncharacterized protein n=1 Tax=Portunus trituberculatus TaxID=210409 RepID=A0A5B7I1H1_PORTR|nr:hypothetical protein [Portunus trituberculatus]
MSLKSSMPPRESSDVWPLFIVCHLLRMSLVLERVRSPITRHVLTILLPDIGELPPLEDVVGTAEGNAVAPSPMERECAVSRHSFMRRDMARKTNQQRHAVSATRPPNLEMSKASRMP